MIWGFVRCALFTRVDVLTVVLTVKLTVVVTVELTGVPTVMLRAGGGGGKFPKER